MRFRETKLKGVWIVEMELRSDERGFFARSYCENEFENHRLNTAWPQCNVTVTHKRGMIRGLHFQADPKPEIKLVRCDAGAILDVVVDVRSDSPTFGKWEAFELRSAEFKTLYIPAGFAHGFQCLEDNCRLFYQMSEFYVPDLARGIRWNDPALGIRWPIENAILSDRDQKLPLLAELRAV
jgi:dTDP-4-dehydrorhamnose 3,5-epimerase